MIALIIPIVYCFTSRLVMVLLMAAVTAIVVYVDISRHYNGKIKDVVNKFFSQYMRESEKSGSFSLSGASGLFFGALIVITLFTKYLAITAILVLIFSDAASGVVGSGIGNQLPNGKSFEGSLSFFVTTILVSFLCYFFTEFRTSFLIIIISSIVTTLTEFYSRTIRVDDNLIIPLAYALTTFVCGLVF